MADLAAASTVRRTSGYAGGVDRSPPKPLLLGRHLLELGMQPGPEMGAVLKQIYEKQLDGEIKTTEEGIALASRILQSQHGGTEARSFTE